MIDYLNSTFMAPPDLTPTPVVLTTEELNAHDSLNRERALDFASFIVEAPAGAGKTELLTQRYLKLLSIVKEPEEIIALTFTNKAAAEMRNRILLNLEHAQNNTPETAPHKLKTRILAIAALKQSQENEWNLLNQPSRLRILTIDALCSSLTRQMPLLSRFGGQPEVSDAPEPHYLEAARRAIAGITQESSMDDPVTTALQFMDNNSEKLEGLLATMLAKRDQWLPLALKQHGVDMHTMTVNAQQALQHLIKEALQLVLATLTPGVQRELMPLARYAASNLPEDGELLRLLDWQDVLTDDAEDLPRWQALTHFLITKSEKTYRKSLSKNNGFPPTDESKKHKEQFLAIVNRLENNSVIAGILGLPLISSLEDSHAVIQALTQLLILSATHLWAVFQAAGQVDFITIAQSASLALENEQGATDLALKLDYKIAHLLIDEFQDTSPVQMNLIEKLIEGWQPEDGRTLFCVGDPMQSIYRFRKADVSLFLQAAQTGIGHLHLTRLQLSRNNRSHPAIVDWINQAFQQIFPMYDNINQGAISYRKFTATRGSVTFEGVIIHPLVIDATQKTNETEEDLEAIDIKQAEAAYVADLIVNLRAEQLLLQSEKELQPEKQLKPAKIAVLVRSRSHLTELVSQFRSHYPQIKFQAVEIEHLETRQSVQDAFSLVCALVHRADRTHWLNLLRAPWCGLTLKDLHALAADNHQATIWQLMNEEARFQTLSEDGSLRLNHVKKILTEAFASQGRMPFRRWLESTWLQLGGGKCLVSAGDNRDVQAFFDLAEKLSLSGYVDSATLESGMHKLYAKPDIESDDSLQFLTIHKSKGLEFDTVIVPALNRKPRHADNPLVLWQEVMVDYHLHLLAAPFTAKLEDSRATDKKTANNIKISLYDYLKVLEKERADNEIVRLLYVAATRTQRQLHLIGSVRKNSKGEIKPIANSLLKVLWPAVEIDFNFAEPLFLNDAVVSDQAVNDQVMQTQNIEYFKPQLQRLYTNEFITKESITNESITNESITNESITNEFKIGSLQNIYTEHTEPTHEVASHANTLSGSNVSMHYAARPLESWTSSTVALNFDRHCGTLAHLYMALFASTGPSAWHQKRLLQCQPAMQHWLIQQGHDAVQARQGAARVQNALQITLDSEAGKWVLQKHSLAASELSLMQLQEKELKNLVIDRTFVEKEVRWIVDYKLTQFDEATNLTHAAEAHRAQLIGYAELFVDENLPIKKAVLFLTLGKLVELE